MSRFIVVENSEDRRKAKLNVDALDALACALAGTRHKWTRRERGLYQQAIRANEFYYPIIVEEKDEKHAD